MSILFGPVPSRRLGRSLGLDMVPYKTCSFNCLYCELGKTTHQTLQRSSDWVKADQVAQELKERLPDLKDKVDYLTLGGSGEPTLNSHLGEIVSFIKEFTSLPLSILTNSSLLSDPKVRRELKDVDLIVPSLDAISQPVFEQINLPLPGITAEEILVGLVALRQEYQGQIWLEILFCQNINDTAAEVELLCQAIEKIRPDRVQINSVVRPPAFEGVLPSTPERLQQIADLIGPKAEVVGQPHLQGADASSSRSFQTRIIEMVNRRPCTLDDLAQAIGLHPVELVKTLNDLTNSGLVKLRSHQGKNFYQKP